MTATVVSGEAATVSSPSANIDVINIDHSNVTATPYVLRAAVPAAYPVRSALADPAAVDVDVPICRYRFEHAAVMGDQ